jgi:hypothetical protein
MINVPGPIRSARGQGGMMSYANWHVQALVWLDQTKADAILIDLLKEPEYEFGRRASPFLA